jgi:hypothetical protein
MTNYDYPKTEVSVQDLCEISLAMDELEGSLKDAVKDAPARIKKDVFDVVNFIYEDVTSKLNQYI